jgi:hypothetical protein
MYSRETFLRLFGALQEYAVEKYQKMNVFTIFQYFSHGNANIRETVVLFLRVLFSNIEFEGSYKEISLKEATSKQGQIFETIEIKNSLKRKFHEISVNQKKKELTK